MVNKAPMDQEQLQTTLFLEDFTVLDFAYLDEVKGIQGESFRVSAELTGTLDAQGFVMDFGKVKKLLKQQVDEHFDHRLALATNSPGLQRISANQNTLCIDFAANTGDPIHYECPEQAIVLLESSAVTKGAIARYLEEKILPKLSSNVKGLKLILREETLFEREANFRYTHGLKLHDGNCQRLIHGHRNLIEVFVNQKKSPEYERYLADLFTDVHFVRRENIQNLDILDLPLEQRQKKNTKTARIFYTAPQGSFLANISAHQIILLENEPSIENITAFAWRELQKKFSLTPASLEVHGYEGLQKGAIVRGFYN